MPPSGVRITKPMQAVGTSRRRRPQQQRSRLTRGAILEAFVRILETEGHEACSLRRITDLAGVGLGSVYDYFPNKQALLAGYFRENSCALQEIIRRHLAYWRANPIGTDARRDAIDSLLAELYHPYASRPQLWKRLAVLEPQVTDSPHYARDAGEFIALWTEVGRMLGPSPESPGLDHRARTFHMALYGSLHYRLVCFPQLPLDEPFLRDLQAVGRLLLLS
jgi:AcrR family transcriptional regulator